MRRASIIAALLTVTSLAHADVVVLKDGTKLHGKLREVAPDRAVTILLENGELRTIEWAAVERADHADDLDKSWVHVVDGGEAYVQMQDADRDWVTVCRGACDQNLVRGGIYRIAGQGIRASKPFLILGETATVVVHPASSRSFDWALAMLIVGAAALVNGATFVIQEAIARSSPGYRPNDGLLVAGGVLGAISVPLFIGGGILLRPNVTTTVTVSF